MEYRYLNKQSLFIGMLLSILLGKIVRYTVMYRTLVAQGIGWHLVDTTNEGNLKFGITLSGTETNEIASNATQNACYIFSKLNFLHLADSYYDYEILISIVFNLILFLLFYKLKNLYSVKESLFIFASVSILNIFAFCLAKEPVQMLYFVLMFYVLMANIQMNRKIIAVCLVYLLSAVTYRNYYVLMAAFFLYFYFALDFVLIRTKRVQTWHIVLILIGMFLFHLLFMSMAKIFSPSNYDELIRVRTRGYSGNSTIYTIFQSTQPIIFSLEYLLVAIRLLVPLELFLLGPRHMVFAVYQIVICIKLIKRLQQYRFLTENRKIAVVAFLAFLFGSATFEPDFGSWVRHEAVLFPIYLIMDGYETETVQPLEPQP